MLQNAKKLKIIYLCYQQNVEKATTTTKSNSDFWHVHGNVKSDIRNLTLNLTLI